MKTKQNRNGNKPEDKKINTVEILNTIGVRRIQTGIVRYTVDNPSKERNTNNRAKTHTPNDNSNIITMKHATLQVKRL